MGDSDEEYGGGSSSNRHNSASGGGSGSSSQHQTTSSSNNNNSSSYNNNNRKNRDKFYRERDDNNSSSAGGGSGGGGGGGSGGGGGNNYTARREWSDERNRGSGGGGADTGSWKSAGGGGNRGGMGGGGWHQKPDYSRKYTTNYDSSPPHKRKKDWDNTSHSSGGYNQHSNDYNSSGGGYSGPNKPHHQSNPPQNYPQGVEAEYPTQPPLLSFKQYLQQQDDSISDEDAIKKYNDYKTEFKKTQINNFFLEHKEEEWFKSRYHPDENYKRRNEQNQYIVNRLDVFMDLFNKGWLDDVSAEYDKSKELIRFLDAVVIKLEGGSDQDVKQLLDGVPDIEIINNFENKKEEKDQSENGDDFHKTNGGDSKKSETNGDNHTNESGDGDTKEPFSKKSRTDSDSESGSYTDSDSDAESGEKKSGSKKKRRIAKESTKSSSSSATLATTTNRSQSSKKQLHKTTSIFMRNLAPSVTKQDLENLAKNHEGFKRVSLSDPAPERGFFRRGWITFDSNVDVKKMCWSFQTIKIKDCNPGAIVNRELTNRIRSIPNLVAHHKAAVKNDLKLAMKIIQNMDKKWNLWQEEGKSGERNGEEESNGVSTNGNGRVGSNEKENETKQEKTEANENSAVKESPVKTAAQTDTDYAKLEESAFSKLTIPACSTIKHKFYGTNPLLNNITDYLVDEMSAEEEELLGQPGTKNSTTNQTTKSTSEIEIDNNFTRVLDKLILYLRVVHSIDYYNCIEYQQEDSMPNRCGIMFVRPALPLNAASASLKVSQDDVQSYMKQFEAKLKPYVEFKDRLEIDQAKKLGTKEQKDEIEKFIKLNTQELAADRWLCPLSGKRFKGPEFIRKHLFYKHMEKIVEVKKEVEYFNNYVFDPKRPQLPEHPSNKQSQAPNQSHAQSNSSSSPMSNQHHHHQQPSYYSQSYMSNSPSILGQPNMMAQNQLPHQFGPMANRQMGGWQGGGFGGGMPDMMQQPQSGYGFVAPQFGGGMGGAPGGFNQGGYRGRTPYGGGGGGFNQNRRGGGGSREMIQYRDLDAPEDT